MPYHPKPHNKRQPKKQSTSTAPLIELYPGKDPVTGPYIMVKLWSQRQKSVATTLHLPWADGKMFEAALELAIIKCAEHQHTMYGDEWDIRDLRTQVKECWRQFVLNARRNIDAISKGTP